MKRFFILVLLVFMLGACAATNDPIITPSDTVDGGYLKKAMDAPLTFSVPKDKAEDAWGRIGGFISKYASMKIQNSTNYSIETFNPSTNGWDVMAGKVGIGYSASRMPKGDQFEFTVNCYSDVLKNATNRNAHILAYFAITGELIERYIRK